MPSYKKMSEGNQKVRTKRLHSQKIDISIIVLAFNHEEYIRETIEGIVRQKTNLLYEIIIHDDASNDDTRSIILEYFKKYPEIIVPIFQNENQYSKGLIEIEESILPQCKGKYLAICEGDDRWTNEDKLQKQYDALENNPDCSICVHDVQTINVEGNKRNQTYPPRGFQTFNHKVSINDYFQFENYLFQTSSYFISKKVFNEGQMIRCEISPYFNGDECWIRSVIIHGPIYYIDNFMSEYRVGVEGSWSTKYKQDEKKAYIYLLKKEVKGNSILNELTSFQIKNVLLKRSIRSLEVLAYLDPSEANSVYKENYSFLNEGIRKLSLKKRLKYSILKVSPKLVMRYMNK